MKDATQTNQLSKLVPSMQKAAIIFLSEAAASGHNIFVTNGHRDFEEQQVLYGQGRPEEFLYTPGPIVTRAKPGMSWHQWGRAIDIAFRGDDPYSESHPWNELGILGETCGLQWGGRWTKFPDRPHFQLPGLLSLRFRTGLKKWGPLEDSMKLDAEFIKDLQSMLNACGGFELKLDGIFGPKTREVLQKVHGKPSLDIEEIEALEDKLSAMGVHGWKL